MTAKEYLSQIRKLDILIKQKELELEDLHIKMTGMSSISMEPDEHSKTHNIKSPQDRMIFKYIEYEKDLEKNKLKLMEVRENVLQTIDSLREPELIDLLYKRYVQFMSWEKIAAKTFVSDRQIKRRHSNALKKIQEKIDNF